MRESDYFDSAAELKPLLHTWSLAVEEQFYLLFPAFLILIWKLGARWTWGTLGLLFVGSFAAAQWAVHEMPAAAFYLLPTRAWELLVGTVVAIHLSRPRRAAIDQVLCEVGGWLGIALILAAILTFDRDTPFPGLHALVPTLGTALIILFATPRTTAGRFVGNRVFVSIGLISYSAYLWHQPLFAFARHRNSSEPDSLAFVALSALTLALAYLSWRFVEAPFRSRTQFSRRSILLMTLLCTMFFVSFGVHGHKSNGFAGRLDPGLAARIPDITQFQDQVEPCWRRIEQHPSVAAACPLGSQAGPIRFGLLGDSHASSLLRTLDAEARKMGLQGRNYSYQRCPPLRLATPTIRDPRESACQELRKDFFETLERDPDAIPDIIIVHARWPLLLQRERFNNREGGVEAGDAWIWELPVAGDDYVANMGAEIRQSIQSILDAGKVVVLIYPVPEMGWDVPKKLMRHLLIEPQIPDHLASVAYSVYLDRTRTAFAALDSIADHDRLIRIRPDQSLCNHALENRCIAHLDGDSLYFDDDHLSNRGARLVLQDVVSRLAALTNAPPDSRGASRD